MTGSPSQSGPVVGVALSSRDLPEERRRTRSSLVPDTVQISRYEVAASGIVMSPRAIARTDEMSSVAAAVASSKLCQPPSRPWLGDATQIGDILRTSPISFEA